MAAKTTKTTLARILTIIYVIMVLFLCLAQFSPSSSLPAKFLGFSIDKVIHFLMFLPLPILSYLSFDHEKPGAWRMVGFVMLTFLFGAALALGTEIAQKYLPYRTYDITDFYADCLALGVSSLLVVIVALCKKCR